MAKSSPGSHVHGEPAMLLRELTVRFGANSKLEVLALNRASFSIAPGEFVSLVGPSGCGKTTILNALAGLLSEPPEGDVKIFGKAPLAGSADCAYMLARDSLLPWRTALGNACFGMEVRKVPRKIREEKALKLLERVGLGGFENRYPNALSHGMRQRCALARAFALDSRALLMDEPFGALDAQTKLQLEDLLMELWSTFRRTVVFVTHDLAEAVALSDRVLVMSARPGRVLGEIPIELPRPRNVRSLQKERRFHELYAILWELMDQGLDANG